MVTEQIVAGARTVSNIAAHFVGLMQDAQRLIESYSASKRGYFTPTEDDEVRHLLVSYWQSRNALIELVGSFCDNQDQPKTDRPSGFLIAYAGALVLVDAARFMREQLHDRPVVRAKLNETEPHFGIPEGTYDTVQKSLTSPKHAWHLNYATRYFDQHSAELFELAGTEPVAPMIEIIKRLEERGRVDLGSCVLARVGVLARQLLDVLNRDLRSKALYGLQKSVSQLASRISTGPGHRPALPGHVVLKLRELLQPGDVLITRKEQGMTNYVLPGYWPHAALYIGDCEQLQRIGIADHPHVKPRWDRLRQCDLFEPRRVLEALKDGVWIRSLACPFESDALAVIRPRLARAQIAEAITRGLFHDGKPYDFDFDFTRSDRLVCTEVVYRSYEGIGGLAFELTRRAGRMTLAAEDLLRMAIDRVYFDPMAVYAPSHASDLLVGDATGPVIRDSMGGA